MFRIGSFSSIERVWVDFEGGSPLMRIGTGISTGSERDGTTEVGTLVL